MSEAVIEKKWSGMLALENISAVVERLTKMLSGKSYTFVAYNESRPDEIEVSIGRRLNSADQMDGNAIKPLFLSTAPFQRSGFDVHDSTGYWLVRTSLEKDGRHDPTYINPSFTFDEDQFTIAHRSDAGTRMVWKVVVEPGQATKSQ